MHSCHSLATVEAHHTACIQLLGYHRKCTTDSSEFGDPRSRCLVPCLFLLQYRPRCVSFHRCFFWPLQLSSAAQVTAVFATYVAVLLPSLCSADVYRLVSNGAN